MKTKELMAKVRSLELEIEMEGCWIVIRTISGAKQLKINKNYASVVFFRGNYSSEIDRNLLNLVVGYLNTPKEEREEEKRYRLLHVTPPLLRRGLMAPEYLYIRRCDGYIDTSLSAEDDPAFQTIFTESEISKMDITGFKKEPVE